jgi:hypothetical protein
MCLVPLFVAAQHSIASEGLKLDFNHKQYCKSSSLDVTLHSRHVDHGKQNEDNFGLGGECEYSKNVSFEAGYYRNSGRHTTKHFGVIYDPIKVSKDLSLGALVGFASGYVRQEVCEQYSGFSVFGECYIPNFTFTARMKFTKDWGANLYYIPAAGGVFGLQARYIFN